VYELGYDKAQAIFYRVIIWYANSNMRFLALSISLFFFVVLPLLLLDTLVMPEVHNLMGQYANQEQTVQRLFPG